MKLSILGKTRVGKKSFHLKSEDEYGYNIECIDNGGIAVFNNILEIEWLNQGSNVFIKPDIFDGNHNHNFWMMTNVKISKAKKIADRPYFTSHHFIDGDVVHTNKYRHFNHHHELTEGHKMVDFGDGEFIANIAAVPLLKALNGAGLRTRTHHYTGSGQGFVSILLDNVRLEIKTVNEIDADRTKYNGKTELLIVWDNDGPI